MPRFVIHEHHARKLHYDLRLEMEGVLKSWAVPKTPTMERGVRRLAIQVDDHPLDYIDFQGTIEEGQYGAGTVKIWDRGTFELEGEPEEGVIRFALNGERLKGSFRLINISLTQSGLEKYGPNKWLFMRA